VGLGAGEVGTLFALTPICSGEDGSSGEGGNETGLGAGAGVEWSGVQKVGVGGRCGVTGKEGECTGVGEAAVVGLGSNRITPSPMPLSSSTSQRLFAAFLIRFAGGGEGAGMVSAVMVRAEAVRPVGAWAGYEVLGTASALQHWRPDCVDEGVCGGISGLSRWQLALGK
jgi:hypothetical protein